MNAFGVFKIAIQGINNRFQCKERCDHCIHECGLLNCLIQLCNCKNRSAPIVYNLNKRQYHQKKRHRWGLRFILLTIFCESFYSFNQLIDLLKHDRTRKKVFDSSVYSADRVLVLVYCLVIIFITVSFRGKSWHKRVNKNLQNQHSAKSVLNRVFSSAPTSNRNVHASQSGMRDVAINIKNSNNNSNLNNDQDVMAHIIHAQTQMTEILETKSKDKENDDDNDENENENEEPKTIKDRFSEVEEQDRIAPLQTNSAQFFASEKGTIKEYFLKKGSKTMFETWNACACSNK